MYKTIKLLLRNKTEYYFENVHSEKWYKMNGTPLYIDGSLDLLHINNCLLFPGLQNMSYKRI